MVYKIDKLWYNKAMKKINTRKLWFIAAVVISLGALAGASGAAKNAQKETAGEGLPNTEQAGGAKVYFTSDISGKGLLSVYRALGVPVSGKVAIKLHMGEPGNQNYLRPELLKDLTVAVKGTFADSNTAYGGKRGTTEAHLESAKEHGFDYAPVDILDADGEIKLPIKNGKHLKEALLGAHIMNYDWIISVAHFKGHSMAGYGGTFKNLAIGIGTPEGKRAIHTSSGEPFFEKIIEYNQALMNAKPGKILYINVLNNLSTDCDCNARAPKATMADIGIMASLDPVALEKASLDMIYARPAAERKDLVERIESRNGAYQVIYSEKMGLGRQVYELVKL
jgi:uncharacterized Fe-S center protein